MIKKLSGILILLFVLSLSGCQTQDIQSSDKATMESNVISQFPIEDAAIEHTAGYSERDLLWLEDINIFSDGYKTNHINLFYWRSEDFFDEMVMKLKENVPNLSDLEIAVELQKIIASMQDFHSSVALLESENFNCELFPFQFVLLEDGLYILNVRVLEGSIPDYSKYLYMKVTSVNGIDIEEIQERLFPVIGGNRYEAAREAYFTTYFQPNVLRAIRVADPKEGFLFTFQNEDGILLEQTVKTISPETRRQSSNLIDYPMYFMRNTTKNWYTYLENDKVLYFAYNVCIDKDGTLNDLRIEMRDILRSGAVKTVVVDLRNNSGGNNTLLDYFLMNLKDTQEQFKDLYIIIGSYTFSAGVDAAVDLSKLDNAILIGAPTGESPDDLGDWRTFELPNSLYLCKYSTKLFVDGKGFNVITADTPLLNFEESSVRPHIYISNDLDNYRNMQDEIMSYILKSNNLDANK